MPRHAPPSSCRRRRVGALTVVGAACALHGAPAIAQPVTRGAAPAAARTAPARPATPDSLLQTRIRDVAITHWGRANGIPHPTIRGMVQDAAGYLWITTHGGLARFDGRRVTVFTESDTPGLVSNVLGPIAVDRAGRLWIGSRDGVSVREGQRFRTLDRTAGLPDGPVTALHVDDAGTVRVAVYQRGVVRWRGDRFVPDPALAPLARLAGLGAVTAIAQRPGDPALWIGTTLAGVLRVEGGAVTRYAEAEGLAMPQVSGLVPVPDGSLLVTTAGGVARLADGRLRMLGPADGVRRGFYAGATVDRRGDLWLASLAGVLRLRGDSAARLDAADGLSDGVVGLVHADRDGNVWAATRRGIDRIGPSVTAPVDLAGANVAAVCRDGPGTLFVATDRAGLFAQAPGGPTVPLAQAPLASGPMHCLPEGGVLFTPSGNAVLALSGAAGRQAASGVRPDTVVRLPSTVDARPLALVRDRAGVVWVGTNGGGLFMARGAALRRYTEADGLPSPVITTLAACGDTLWVGTERGIARVVAGAVTPIRGAGARVAPFTWAFTRTRDGLWAGTGRGLVLLRGDSARLLGAREGLSLDNVRVVTDDGAGGLWLAGANGIARLVGAELEAWRTGRASRVSLVMLGPGDGVTGGATAQFQPRGWADGPDRAWIGGPGGLVAIDLRAAATSPAVPAPLIDGVTIGDSVHVVDPGAELVVPADAPRLTLGLSAPRLRAAERLVLRYKLEGFDRGWTEATGEPWRASYTNLPAGRYRFLVESSNGDGHWVAAAALPLRQRAVFYRTPWFLALAGATGVLALVAWRRRSLHQLALRHEAVLAERLRIAGAVHDTLLQDFSAVALKLHVAQAAVGASAVQRELENVLSLVDRSLREGRTAVWDMRHAEPRAPTLAAALEDEAATHAALGGLPVHVAIVGRPRPLGAARELELRHIAAEAMRNAVRHGRATRVDVTLRFTARQVELEVRDDGIGFDAGAPHEGRFGLVGMRERARRAKATLTIGRPAPGGTAVVVTLPSRRWARWVQALRDRWRAPVLGSER